MALPTTRGMKKFESVTGWPRSYCYVYFEKVYHYMLCYGLELYGSFSLSFHDLQTFSFSHQELYRARCVNRQECDREKESEQLIMSILFVIA